MTTRPLLLWMFWALAAATMASPEKAAEHLDLARDQENLVQAAAEYKSAAEEDPAGVAGQTAALELGQLEIALGRPEAALGLFASLRASGAGTALTDDQKAKLGYWNAQALLAAKRPDEARLGFESMAKDHPEHPLAAFALKQASGIARPGIEVAKAAATPAKKQARAFTVQVGAFGKRAGARAMYLHLKKAGYSVRLQKLGAYHLVQVGQYQTRAEALKAAETVKQRERLPAFRIIEINESP